MPSREPIAITGLAGRFPLADTADALWRQLIDGVDAVRAIPEGRWNLDALRRFADGAPLPAHVTQGGWLDSTADFDPGPFRLSPREARMMDPKHRLALEVSAEALRDAQLAPEQRPDLRVGVWFGVSQSEYLMRFYHRREIGNARADRYLGTGNDPAFPAGRIAAALGLTGPASNLDTACSTSLVATMQAIESLRAGSCDAALAGGVTLVDAPEHSLTMTHFGMLSPTARCRAFDAAADGYVRGEGCGVVVLRRLTDAQRDGDRVYAVIRGGAVNTNGRSDAIIAPSRTAQERLIAQALADAGVEGHTVQVAEAHGTGTPQGDPAESQALVAALSGPRSAPLVAASVKTNLGHLELAAGVAGLIKVVLSIQHGLIPRHLHLHERAAGVPGPGSLQIPGDAAIPWPAGHGPRRALVNSFGISGINAAVVVESAPPAPPVSAAPRPHAVLTLSASSPTALAAMHRLTPDAATAAALNRAQTGLSERAAVCLGDGAADALAALAEGQAHPKLLTGSAYAPPKVAFVFTGQGAQHTGMGRALAEAEPTFADALAEVEDALAPHLRVSIREVMWGEHRDADLTHTQWAQPALFALGWALARLWRDWGVAPSVLLGHSIGEITAAAVGDALSLADAARLVAHRARAMGALPRGGGMASLLMPREDAQALLERHPTLRLAADNAPDAVAIAGPDPDIDALIADAGQDLARRLVVSHAFHHPLMQPAASALADLGELSVSPPSLPVLSNLTGGAAPGDFATVPYWQRHLLGAVRFREQLSELGERGVQVALELGPDAVLCALGRRVLPNAHIAWVPSLRRAEPLPTFQRAWAQLHVHGVPLQAARVWAQHPQPHKPVPAYPWQRQRLWVDDPGPPPVGPAASQTTDPLAGPRAYRLAWLPLDAGSASTVNANPGHWIVGVDANGRIEGLARGLEDAGHRVTRVQPRGGTRSDAATVDPADPDAFAALVTPDLRGWVHGWPMDAPGLGPHTTAADLIDAEDRASLAALHIARAILPVDGTALWCVTQGATAAGGPIAPAQAGVWGLLRVVGLEHPELPLRRVDLGPNTTMAQLLGHVQSLPGAPDLAIRRGRLLTPRLIPVSVSLTPPTLRGTWLVTGGLGALGLHLAGDLCQQGVGHLVLLGRNTPTQSAQERIDAWRAQGVQVDVHATDVADAASLERIIQPLQGRLRGVIHAAGVLADTPAARLTREALRAVLPAKVAGAWHLHRLTAAHALDAFVLMGSVTAITGATGQANYAVANAFLDALATHRAASGQPSLCVNWGPWAHIGMAAPFAALMKERGVHPLDPKAASALLWRLLGSAEPTPSVLDLHLPTLLPRGSQVPPLLAEIAAITSGSRAESTPQRPQDGHEPKTPDAASPRPSPTDAAASRPRDRVARAADPQAALAEELGAIAAHLLGLERGALPLHRPLAWQGLDSVMALDLRARIEADFGAAPPQARLAVGPSCAELAADLLPRLDLQAPGTAADTREAVATASEHAPAVDPQQVDPSARALAVLTEEVSALLGFEPGELDPKRPLAWQGFDSVMALDLQRRIDARLGVSLPMSSLTHGPRLAELAQTLATHLAEAPPLDAKEARPAPAPPPPTAHSPPHAQLTQAHAEAALPSAPASAPPPPDPEPSGPAFWMLTGALLASAGWAAWTWWL